MATVHFLYWWYYCLTCRSATCKIGRVWFVQAQGWMIHSSLLRIDSNLHFHTCFDAARSYRGQLAYYIVLVKIGYHFIKQLFWFYERLFPFFLLPPFGVHAHSLPLVHDCILILFSQYKNVNSESSHSYFAALAPLAGRLPVVHHALAAAGYSKSHDTSILVTEVCSFP